MSGNYLKEVRNQYEEFPYPPVDPENEKYTLKIPFTEAFSYITHYCFSGKKDMRKNCRFLVAGGGTGDAAIGIMEQLMAGSENCEVVYVDISQASMKIAKERARIRGFEDRITWQHGSLLSIPEIGLGTFDYIDCSGVLHHLESPDDGLKALVSVLKPEGVLSIMLYAQYGRTAVYQMQDLLRLINQNAESSQQKLDNTKKILNDLPATNWLIHSPPTILNEIRWSDAAIYDLLLHSQDRAYSVPEIYNFVGKQNFEIIEFFADDGSIWRDLYNPELYVKDAVLLQQIQALPKKDQRAIAELLNGKICRHIFYAARKIPTLPSLDDPDMVPYFDISFAEDIYETFRQVVAQSHDIITFKSSDGVTVLLKKTPHLELLSKYFDGKRGLNEICELVLNTMDKKPTIADLKLEFSLVYSTFHSYRWMFLRHKNIQPYENNTIMQERVAKMYA